MFPLPSSATPDDVAPASSAGALALTVCYRLPPYAYDMAPRIAGQRIRWREFDCTHWSTEPIPGEPSPAPLSGQLAGNLNFDRVHLTTKKFERFDAERSAWIGEDGSVVEDLDAPMSVSLLKRGWF